VTYTHKYKQTVTYRPTYIQTDSGIHPSIHPDRQAHLVTHIYIYTERQADTAIHPSIHPASQTYIQT